MDTKRIEELLDVQQERFDLMAEVKGAATDNYASTNKKIKSLLGEGWVSATVSAMPGAIGGHLKPYRINLPFDTPLVPGQEVRYIVEPLPSPPQREEKEV